MPSVSNRSSGTPRSAGIKDRGVTVSDNEFIRQLVTPLRRYIPVGWFDWEPFGKRPKSWWPDLWMFLAFVAIAFFVSYPSWLVRLDWDIRMFATEANDNGVLLGIAKVFAELGQARTVATIAFLIAIWLALRARSIRPLLMYVLTYITLAGILGLKHFLGRPQSQHPFSLEKVSPEGPMIFTYHAEGGGPNIVDATAFPSGHAVNSIILFGLIVMLIGGLMPRWARWSLMVFPPLLVGVAQVFVTGQHWFSDEPAGFLLGLIIIRCAQRVPWHEIPLGPLKVFDPARRSTILIMTILIVGCMVTPTLHLTPALILAAVIPVVGLLWLWVTTQTVKRRRAAGIPGYTEIAEARAAAEREAETGEIPMQSEPDDSNESDSASKPSDSSRRA